MGGKGLRGGKGGKGLVRPSINKPRSWPGESKGFGKSTSSTGQSESWLPGGHAILLVQYSDRSNSRTYSEHDTVSRAMDDICQMYEQVIKMDGGRSQAKYTIEDLWAFVDRLEDIACLVYDTKLGEYRPHNREWIKNQVLKHLKVQLV
ncbi:unnamed protein product [Durusdinium trenchii]|uniref:Enhancer of rudimentary homolog n=1 Tax=Durusdinium trenchii TaxID=1381693 RepID=A0ABP0K9U2_9DINO